MTAPSSKTSKNIEILAAADHRGGIQIETSDPKLSACCDRPCKHGFPDE
jgi:hypothetical protein